MAKQKSTVNKKVKRVTSTTKKVAPKREKNVQAKEYSKDVAKPLELILSEVQELGETKETVLAIADKHEVDAHTLAEKLVENGIVLVSYDVMQACPTEWSLDKEIYARA
jgi:hypothetical protein